MLHSRLFAQFMHQAFPRECPYPHLVGTTTSLSPTAWSQTNGIPYRIDHIPGTRKQVLNTTVDKLDSEYSARQGQGDASPVDDAVDDLMWTLDEESFVVPNQSLLQRIVSLLTCLGSRLFAVILLVVFAFGAISTKATMVFRNNERAKLDAVFV
jgi:hypothetical protein